MASCHFTIPMARGKKRKSQAKGRSKLADKKINTLVERRCKEIAEKAVKSKMVKNSVVGEYGSYYATGQPRIWNQIVSEAVPFYVAGGFLPAAGTPVQPTLRVPLYANQQIGGISYASMPEGARRTNKIYVTGFKMTGMIRKKSSSQYSDVDWIRVSLHESALKFNAFPSAAQLASVIGSRTDPPKTGFMIDETDQDDAQYHKQQKILHSKTYKISTRDAHLNGFAHRTFTFQKYFKQPKMIFYDDSDTQGSSPWNRILWCQVQSSGINEDATSNQTMGLPTTSSPEIVACCKLFFHEKS